MRTVIHKVVLLVTDHDGMGQEEVTNVLQETRYPNHCIYPKVMGIETKEIDYEDSHPLNQRDTARAAFNDLFKEVQ